MKQILVATDFSNSAANAMEYGMSLAKALDMEVCVLHAIHPTEGVDNNIYKAIYIDDYYTNKRQALKDWAEIKVRVNQLRLPSGNRLTVARELCHAIGRRGA